MATPWIHPQTGVYHLRRQIPRALRPAFGGSALYKKSLGTKDVAQAAILFTQANGELERRFEEARHRLVRTGSPGPSSRDRADDLVRAYFNGPEFPDGGLDGSERLELARVEIDRGLWNETDRGLSFPLPVDEEQWSALANNAALFRSWRERRSVKDDPPGTVWRWKDSAFKQGARRQQVGRVLLQIVRFDGAGSAPLLAELPDSIAAFLDEQPVSASRERRARPVLTRSRPDLRMTELLGEWNATLQRSEQTAHEFGQSLHDFVEMHGDIPAGEVTNDDLLNYRDEAVKLPRSMPRADRKLPFSRRVAKHADTEEPRVSPTTVKKRIGAIQALLTLAFKQKWIEKNVGSGTPIEGVGSGMTMKRSNFNEDQLQTLFSSPLFVSPSTWRSGRKVTDATRYWLFLLCLTTGARIEEIGQALLSDVKTSGDIIYIDVDDYIEDDEAAIKSVKTPDSRRVIPIHDHLKALGFARYVEAMRKAGKTQLFPDLIAGTFNKHTKEASRVCNRLIDKVVSRDRRLVFHSLRHQFKDFALEAGITERVVDQITGHVPTTIGGRYGSGVRLPALNGFLHKVDWSFIDWATLERSSAQAGWNRLGLIAGDGA